MLFTVEASEVTESIPPLIFLKRIIFVFLKKFFRYFKVWRILLCYLFLSFRTTYASIFRFKIESLEEYYLAMDIVTSFTYFKTQYCTRKSSFYLFFAVENPVKPRIKKSRKNLDKQGKIDLEKQTMSSR